MEQEQNESSRRASERQILWIDDEPYFIEEFIAELRRTGGVHVNVVSDVGAAMDFIEQQTPRMLIWDMIIPPGILGAEKTSKGLRTGAVFYEMFRRKDACKDVPALLFTNVSRPDVLQLYDSPRNGSWVIQKRELLPGEFCERVLQDMLYWTREQPPSSR